MGATMHSFVSHIRNYSILLKHVLYSRHLMEGVVLALLHLPCQNLYSDSTSIVNPPVMNQPL